MKKSSCLSISVIWFSITAGIFLGLYFGTYYSFSNSIQSIQLGKNQSIISTEEHPGLPIKIIIPKIDLDTAIEVTGIDNLGRMGVPKNVNNVAWYQYGSRPGSIGNAVIDGHLDTHTGTPAAFYYLNKLSIGDKIEIIDSNNKTYIYIIYSIRIYPYNKVPLKLIFGSSSNYNLNLITCDGIFNRKSKNYTDRIVIFSKMM